MATKNQVQANRSNAKRSTGPISREGKATVARNALRHGLAVPLAALREFEEPVSRLAELLVETGDAARLEDAQPVAESVIDWMRIRRLKTILLAEAHAANFETGLVGIAALARYERRSLSRRKTAMRPFEGGD